MRCLFLVRGEHERQSGISEDAWNAITDHYPVIGLWIDDSTWLECWCGWSQSDDKAVPGWWEHIEAALMARSEAPSIRIPKQSETKARVFEPVAGERIVSAKPPRRTP